MNRALPVSKLFSFALFAFLVFTLVLTLAVVPASAQVSKGSISGTVLDPSGAAVVDADVKATSTETSQTSSTKSDATGSFRINLLPPGTYKIELKKEGFRSTSMSNVGVAVSADTALGGVKLELGATAETVEVSSAAPIVESTQAQVTNTFSTVELTNLPGIQENQGLDTLAVLLPGVSGSRDLGFSNTNGGTGFSVNGIRGRNNDQEIDGQNNNDNSVAGPGVFLSNSEFAEQYQVVTSNFGPEYGRNSGSVVNIITKSGTNNWHGVIKGTESNSALNSLSNIQRAPTASPFGSGSGIGLGLKKVPHFNDSFVTATIGGPLVKNHAFLFAGYDTEIDSSNNLYSTGLLTPTPTGIGQMSGCYTSAASKKSIAALTKFGPYGIGGGNPTPVNPSPIALNGIDPATGNPFSGFVPNGTDPTTGLPACLVEMGGVQRLLPNSEHSYDWITRLDVPTGKETISIRYLWQKLSFFDLDSFITGYAALGYPNNVPSTGQQLAMDWTHQISNHMVNDFRLTYGRLRVEFGGNTIGNTVPHQGQVEDAVTNVIFLNTTLGGYGPATNSPQGRIVNTYQVQDNWTDVVGKHTLKAGVNFTYQRSPNLFLPTANGQYRFDDWNSYAGNEPDRIRAALGNDDLDFREKDTFGYVGDDFKIKSNLTLNLGVTYTYYGQPANLFHTNDLKLQTGSHPLWDPALPQSVTVAPNIPSPKNSWGPGVGFAYSPQWGGFFTGTGKMVIRGGYRLSYDPPYYNIYLNEASAAPQVLLQTLGRGTAATNPLPAVPLGPNVRSALSPVLTPGIFDPRQFNSTNISPNFGPDHVHQWSFGLQRELGAHAAVEASYVGNRGYNLFQSINGNPDISSYPANQLPPGVTPCANSFVPTNPASKRDDTGRLSCSAPAVLRTRNNGGYSNYNGLQTEFRTNGLFNQLTMKANYTFSKTLDNVSEIFSTFAGGGSNAFAQNPLNTGKGEYGISGLNFRHTFTMSAYEALPFFKSQHGIVGHMFGGWGLSGTYIWQSGQPYTPTQLFFGTFSGGCCNDTLFDGTFIGTDDNVRPFYGNPSAPAGAVGAYAGDTCNFLSTATFTDPSCSLAPTTILDWTALNSTGAENQVTKGQVRYLLNGPTAQGVFGTPFGSVARNQVTDAITNTTNLEVSKNVKWGERVNVTWHMSLVNAFNHPNYGYTLGGADAAFTSGGIDPLVDADAGLANRFGAGTGFADPKVFDGGHRTIRFGLRISF